MFAARLVGNGCRTSVVSRASQQLVCRSQGYASGGGRSTVNRLRTRMGAQTTPAADTAFTMGQGLLAGAAVVGMGSLCYYGIGLSKEAGAIDRAVLWPDLVKQRIKTTYGYFGSSLAFTAAAAVTASRSAMVMNVMQRHPLASLFGCIAAMWGTGMYCQSLPYTEGFGKKQLAWMAHSAVVGTVIAPLMALGGPLLLRAAVYTAGMVGGLSTLAACAPSEKFLNMGGPLAMGFGVVFMSSIGTWFLPPTTALGAGMYSIAVYGGLVLFGMFLLYDTQKIIKRAETTPIYAERPFDPINNSVGIYMDTINIFIRIVSILAGNRRK